MLNTSFCTLKTIFKFMKKMKTFSPIFIDFFNFTVYNMHA